SCQAVLQADVNLARVFDTPLTSDLKADRLCSLSRECKPHILEADQAGCTIPRLILSYPQHITQNSRSIANIMSTWIMQLVNPYSYYCDGASETNIVKMTRSQIEPRKDLTLQSLYSPHFFIT
ncbi:hypothetical protein N7539_008517, partial [Penicillium diatomitis]